MGVPLVCWWVLSLWVGLWFVGGSLVCGWVLRYRVGLEIFGGPLNIGWARPRLKIMM